MEIIKKIFLIAFLGLVLIFIGLSLYIQKNGKALVEQRLSLALHKEVHVGKTRLMFPLGLRFDSVEIKDALTAKILRVNLGLPIFFGDHFNIAKIKLTEPIFYITYTNDKKIVWGTVPIDVPAESAPLVVGETAASHKGVKNKQGVIIDYFEVTNGRVKVFDQPHRADIDIGQINLKALEITLPPKDMKTKFDFSAMVLSEHAPFAGQRVEARGMANFVALNMDATAKVADAAGNSSFAAHFKSINNEMLVKGTINVGRFVSGISAKNNSESSLESFLANALESSGVEIGVNFTCQTKMNDFNCDKIGMSGNVVQNQQKPVVSPVAVP